MSVIGIELFELIQRMVKVGYYAVGVSLEGATKGNVLLPLPGYDNFENRRKCNQMNYYHSY